MRGIEPEKSMLFSKIMNVYERLAALRGKRGKETELAKFFFCSIEKSEIVGGMHGLCCVGLCP